MKTNLRVAHLMAIGLKKNETRHWTTSHRGDIAIHAAKRKIDSDGFRLCRAFKLIPEEMSFGALVAIVTLDETSEIESKVVNPPEDPKVEWYLGNYEPNRFAWKTTNLRRLSPPIPFVGRQGIFNVPDELITNALYESDL